MIQICWFIHKYLSLDSLCYDVYMVIMGTNSQSKCVILSQLLSFRFYRQCHKSHYWLSLWINFLFNYLNMCSCFCNCFTIDSTNETLAICLCTMEPWLWRDLFYLVIIIIFFHHKAIKLNVASVSFLLSDLTSWVSRLSIIKCLSMFPSLTVRGHTQHNVIAQN